MRLWSCALVLRRDSHRRHPMPVEQSSLEVVSCLLLVDNPLPCLRSGRFRYVASNGSSVAGRLDSPEEQLD